MSAGKKLSVNSDFNSLVVFNLVGLVSSFLLGHDMSLGIVGILVNLAYR